ncbi:MAG: hypothetical protein IKO35_03420 [Elusimicrobiaceae bacterium]|nr:hypothetical protein [Elusimicrobiaceae bacterium]
MRIYDIHNQHPEWVEEPTAYRAEIREAAHAYIWDFFKMGADVRDRVLLRDLNAIADNRNQIQTYWEYNGNPEAEPTEYRQDRAKCYILEKVFGYIIRYLAYYGYALKYEDVEQFYIGREDKELIFIAPEDWLTTGKPQANEDFAEIADILRIIERKESQQTNYINVGDKLAESLYKELSDSKVILDCDCSKDNFLWYFGDDTHRTSKEQPNIIKWYGGINEFAYFALLMTLQTEGNVSIMIEWEKYKRIFKNGKTGEEWKGLETAANKMKSPKNALPAKFKIKSLECGTKLLEKLRDN